MPFVRRLLTPALLLLALICAPARAAAPDVYVFWREGCPHCEEELEFLEALRAHQPDLRVHLLEVGGSAGNLELLREVAQRLGAPRLAVPFTVVGSDYVIGFQSAATTGVRLEALIEACRRTPCADLVDAQKTPAASPLARAPPAPVTIRIPFLGEVLLEDWSLPALTVVLAAVDGFNPCAMWVLVFLIGLLLGMQDRARMWTLGGTFIVASAAVYFLFMAAWLNLLLFIGMLLIVRVFIALVAIGAGVYYLREFAVNKEAVCKVTGQPRRRRVFDRLRILVNEPRFALALIGMVLLAFAVNLVELLCSAGIPAVFAQVLAMSELASWQYYLYLLLYVCVFMLDDLIVFVTAMKTLQLTGLSSTYARYAHLIGGVMLLIIGVLMLARPEWLMFG
jgi:glutaredoxin